jgi:hypothetical protein
MVDLSEIANEMMSHLGEDDGVQAMVMLRYGPSTRSELHGFDMESDPMAPAVWMLSSAVRIARANGKQVVAFRMKGVD